MFLTASTTTATTSVTGGGGCDDDDDDDRDVPTGILTNKLDNSIKIFASTSEISYKFSCTTYMV
jgi:hypothetical protein